MHASCGLSRMAVGQWLFQDTGRASAPRMSRLQFRPPEVSVRLIKVDCVRSVPTPRQRFSLIPRELSKEHGTFWPVIDRAIVRSHENRYMGPTRKVIAPIPRSTGANSTAMPALPSAIFHQLQKQSP